MNNITIVGRLAQDPTVGKAKSSGEPVTLFNIASDSLVLINKTDFLHCMANYHTGKYVAQYGTKGMTIYVEGELTTGEHTNRDGIKIPDFTIIVNKARFLSKNPNQQNAPQTAPALRNSAPIYQDACRSGQQQNGYTPQGNGYLAPPRYQQSPKTDFLEAPDIEDCPFN